MAIQKIYLSHKDSLLPSLKEDLASHISDTILAKTSLGLKEYPDAEK